MLVKYYVTSFFLSRFLIFLFPHHLILEYCITMKTYREHDVCCSGARGFLLQVSQCAGLRKYSVPDQFALPNLESKEEEFSSSVQLLVPQRMPCRKLRQITGTWHLHKWKKLHNPLKIQLHSSIQCCHKAYILMPKDQHILGKLHTAGTDVSIHLCSCNCWPGRNNASGRATQVV